MNTETKEKPPEPLLGEKPVIINIGLAVFEDSLRQQGAEVVAVRWRPPRKASADIAALLDRLL